MQKQIPADLQIDILRRLPLARWIVRFRCVSKSWCALLSDPSFARQKLFFSAAAADENPDPSSSSSPLTMIVKKISHGGHDGLVARSSSSSVYSLHSCTTLEPLLQAELPFDLDTYRIAGCCNGLLCMHLRCFGYVDTRPASLILWNPATSETKVLPPTLFDRPCDDDQHATVQAVGFGFDPETNDYKVVRVIDYMEFGWHIWKDPFVEVYSLRNDSWKKILDDNIGRGGGNSDDHCFPPLLPYPQFPQCSKGKLYWSNNNGGKKSTARFVSFDLSREVFETVAVVKNPPAKHGLVYSFFVQDCLAAVCSFSDASPEIWALLELRVSESWTKLFTIPAVMMTAAGGYTILGVSGDFLFYEMNSKLRSSYDRKGNRRMHAACRVETGEIVDLRIPFESISQIVNYVPRRVSLF